MKTRLTTGFLVAASLIGACSSASRLGGQPTPIPTSAAAPTMAAAAETVPSSPGQEAANATGTAESGCGAAAAPDFGPEASPGNAFGAHMPIAIRGTGTSVTSSEAKAAFDLYLAPAWVPDQLSEQLILSASDGSARVIRTYYAKAPVSKQMALEDFFANPAIMVLEEDAIGQTAETVVGAVGERARSVEVGSFDAAMVRADPIGNDITTYNLYWSDGLRDWTITGSTAKPEDIIDVGRSIYCT